MRFCSQKLMKLWKHGLAQKLDFAFSRFDFVLKVAKVFENLDFKLRLLVFNLTLNLIGHRLELLFGLIERLERLNFVDRLSNGLTA